MDDDVGAELQRLLQVRRGERVVDHDQRADRVGRLGGGLDVERFSSGFVGDSIQTRRVRSSRCARRFG